MGLSVKLNDVGVYVFAYWVERLGIRIHQAANMAEFKPLLDVQMEIPLRKPPSSATCAGPLLTSPKLNSHLLHKRREVQSRKQSRTGDTKPHIQKILWEHLEEL